MEKINVMFILVILPSVVLSAVNEENCEVCVKFVRRLYDAVPADEKADPAKIEKYFKDTCKTAQGKDERLCYYLGGLKTSATYIVNEMTKPMSWSMPAEKVCERLKAKDAQICELKYEKLVDLKTAKLKKLKVKELRKILDSWGIQCKGCTEKTEFIKLIEDRMPEFAPEAAEARKKAEL